MQISFDPRDQGQCETALALILATHPEIQVPGTVMTGEQFRANVREAVADIDPAAAFGDGASAEQAFAPAPLASAPPPPASPAPATAAATTPTPPLAASPPATGVETDKEGLPWDNRIHSTPAKINKSDGLWRAKKNLDAAERERVVAELRQAMGAPIPPSSAAPAAGGASPIPAPAAAESTTAPPAPPPTLAAAATASGPDGAANASSPPPPPVPAAPPAPVPAHDPLVAAINDGWTPHPESAGWYYKGQEVVAEADFNTRYPAPAAAPPPVPTAPPAPPAAAAGAAPTDFAGLMRKITGLQTAGHLTVERTTQISQELGITGVRDLMHRPDLIPSFDAKLPVVA